ncbi:MAG: hypothetical protein ABI187_03535 [Ornithinibacter sp.]
MPHYTTGLPKLDLEPFDATPLWEAARSSQSEPPTRARGLRARLALTVVILGGLGVLGAVLALAL